MPKLKYLILILFMLFNTLIPASVSAELDVRSEVKTVTSAVDNIYTLYIGMPKEDFKQNFSNVAGWGSIVNYDKYGHVLDVPRNYSKGDPVQEKIRVYFEGNKVYYYTFSFSTSYKQFADQIYDQAVKNFLSILGEENKHSYSESSASKIITDLKKHKMLTEKRGGKEDYRYYRLEKSSSWIDIENNIRLFVSLAWTLEDDNHYTYCVKITRCSNADPCFACIWDAW